MHNLSSIVKPVYRGHFYCISTALKLEMYNAAFPSCVKTLKYIVIHFKYQTQNKGHVVHTAPFHRNYCFARFITALPALRNRAASHCAFLQGGFRLPKEVVSGNWSWTGNFRCKRLTVPEKMHHYHLLRVHFWSKVPVLNSIEPGLIYAGWNCPLFCFCTFTQASSEKMMTSQAFLAAKRKQGKNRLHNKTCAQGMILCEHRIWQ